MEPPVDSRIRDVLDRLHVRAKSEWLTVLSGLLRGLGGLRPVHMREACIAVSREQGALLYSTVRTMGARNIVEFGASFGISSLYLGAAARQTGGRVLTTEIEPTKIVAARDNIAEAGLEDVVTLLAGNALETLAHHEGPIDLVFLDGWSDLYVPLMALLGPRTRVGGLVLVDNANLPGTRSFLVDLFARPGVVGSRINVGGAAMGLACITAAWKSWRLSQRAWEVSTWNTGDESDKQDDE